MHLAFHFRSSAHLLHFCFVLHCLGVPIIVLVAVSFDILLRYFVHVTLYSFLVSKRFSCPQILQHTPFDAPWLQCGDSCIPSTCTSGHTLTFSSCLLLRYVAACTLHKDCLTTTSPVRASDDHRTKQADSYPLH